jgi:hypothetical protein
MLCGINKQQNQMKIVFIWSTEMKKSLLIFCFISSVLFFTGCPMDTNDTPEQKYDMIEYIVSSSDYTKCETQMQTYGDDEPNKQILNQFEQWIVVNTTAQVIPTRDLTRGEITDALLQVTSISRDQINTLFQKVDSIGKYLAVLTMQGGSRDILFIDKL